MRCGSARSTRSACCRWIGWRPRDRARAAAAAFGLSGREATLAVRLCLGDTLEEAARRLGMRRETARSHLAACFAKTGTARQHTLVGLLLSTLPNLPS